MCKQNTWIWIMALLFSFIFVVVLGLEDRACYEDVFMNKNK